MTTPSTGLPVRRRPPTAPRQPVRRGPATSGEPLRRRPVPAPAEAPPYGGWQQQPTGASLYGYPKPTGRGGLPQGALIGLALGGVLLLVLAGGFLVRSRSSDNVSSTTTASGSNAGASTRPSAGSPTKPAAATGTKVTLTLPSTIDGQDRATGQAAKGLTDGLKSKLTNPQSKNPAVGLYGDPSASGFLVAAARTTLDPQLVMKGLAVGMEQSAGSLDFVDQDAGPLGGSMQCAESPSNSLTSCIWGATGVYGVTIVYNADVAQAAATTLTVRDAVEQHTS